MWQIKDTNMLNMRLAVRQNSDSILQMVLNIEQGNRHMLAEHQKGGGGLWGHTAALACWQIERGYIHRVNLHCDSSQVWPIKMY